LGYHGQKKFECYGKSRYPRQGAKDDAAPRGAVESNHQVEGDLRRLEAMNIKRLIDIGTYRGRRHRMGYQRAANPHHARTRRRRQTVAGKKKAPSGK